MRQPPQQSPALRLGLLNLAGVVEQSLLAEMRLSASEQRRLAELNNGRRRRDWLAGRWAARQLLGKLTAAAFEITAENNKPQVIGSADLFVNWSHSGNWLLAIAGSVGPLGCDVELCKPRQQLSRLIQHSFTPAEASSILALPAAEQLPAFYSLWTQKEALLKAVGIGIARGLKQPEFFWQAGRWALPAGDIAVTQWLNSVAGEPLSCAVALPQKQRHLLSSEMPAPLELHLADSQQ